MPPLRQMKCCVSVSAKGTSRQLACKKWPQLSHPNQSNPSFTTRLFSASQIAQHILVYRTQSSLLTRLMYSWYQRINDQMTFQYYPEFRPENVLQRQNVNRILLGTLPDAIDTFPNASIVYYSWKRYMYKQCFWKLFNILFSEVYNTIVFCSYQWSVCIWSIKVVSLLTTQSYFGLFSFLSSSPVM